MLLLLALMLVPALAMMWARGLVPPNNTTTHNLHQSKLCHQARVASGESRCAEGLITQPGGTTCSGADCESLCCLAAPTPAPTSWPTPAPTSVPTSAPTEAPAP